MTDLDTALTALVGQAAAKALAAQLEITTAGELLRHYPRRYVEREPEMSAPDRKSVV